MCRFRRCERRPAKRRQSQEVARLCPSNACGSLSGGLELAQLLARMLRQVTAHPNHAGIVLVQHLVLLQTRPQPAENFAVLLQDFPMPRLQRGLVEEAPHVALPPAHLANSPEEDG